jgi:hypothetical protein
VKNTIVTVDEDFLEIDRLLRELRSRIARAAEAVHVAAEDAAIRRRAPIKARKRAATAR